MISRVSENALTDLILSSDLKSSGRSAVFTRISAEKPDAFNRAALVLLAKKGETTPELETAWKTIRRVEKTKISAINGVVDTCGTGGDGSHSLNLSTLSSFVMAGAGLKVIKHGNKAITSRCGSSDLLESFGMNLKQAPAQVVKSAQKTGMGYFHAPSVHPVYGKVQAMRRGIKVRTLFNLLGPVLNPVQVTYQILGVSKPELLPAYADLLPRLGRKSALVAQGFKGMDEITSLGPSIGYLVCGNSTKKWSLNPSEYGLKKGKGSDLQIHSVAHAKARTIAILKNSQAGAGLDSVLLSAACGIWIAGKTSNLKDALTLARFTVRSGRAWNVLLSLVKFSHDS